MPATSTPPSEIPPQAMRVAPPLGCLNYLMAALGSVLIGVTLPCALVGLRTLGNIQIQNGPDHHHFDFVDMVVVAIIFCSPGAIVFSLLLLAILERQAANWSLRRSMVEGAIFGIMMAFANVPGYFAIVLLQGDTFVYARVMLLFVVAGASCGIWIAWQAWRKTHPQERFLPRFSLRTIMLLVLLWGAVMLVFQPQQWPGQWPEQPVPHHHGER